MGGWYGIQTLPSVSELPSIATKKHKKEASHKKAHKAQNRKSKPKYIRDLHNEVQTNF
jgi:hypothetical protein